MGVNRFESTEPSPLTADLETAIQGAWTRGSRSGLRRSRRCDAGAGSATTTPGRASARHPPSPRLVEDAATDTNLMAATLEVRADRGHHGGVGRCPA